MANLATIKERIAVLESKVEGILNTHSTSVRPKDWRKTIGRFGGDELMKKIDAEGRKIRVASHRTKGK